jgi:hypothetical protein
MMGKPGYGLPDFFRPVKRSQGAGSRYQQRVRP